MVQELYGVWADQQIDVLDYYARMGCPIYSGHMAPASQEFDKLIIRSEPVDYLLYPTKKEKGRSWYKLQQFPNGTSLTVPNGLTTIARRRYIQLMIARELRLSHLKIINQTLGQAVFYIDLKPVKDIRLITVEDFSYVEDERRSVVEEIEEQIRWNIVEILSTAGLNGEGDKIRISNRASFAGACAGVLE
jgi:hypothetical protein